MIAAGKAAEAEMAEPTLQQVVRPQPGDRFVVRADKWKAQACHRSAEVDDRQLQAAQSSGNGRIFDACKNAVPVPSGEPWGRWIAQALRLEVSRPIGPLVLIGGNATQ